MVQSVDAHPIDGHPRPHAHLSGAANAAGSPAGRGCMTRLTMRAVPLRGDCIRATAHGWDITTTELRVGRSTFAPRDLVTARFSVRRTASGPVLRGPVVTARCSTPARRRGDGELDLRAPACRSAARPPQRDGQARHTPSVRPAADSAALSITGRSRCTSARPAGPGRPTARSHAAVVFNDAVTALVDGRSADGCLAVSGRTASKPATATPTPTSTAPSTPALTAATGSARRERWCSTRTRRALAASRRAPERRPTASVPVGLAGESSSQQRRALPVVTITSPAGVRLTTPSAGVTAIAGATMIGAIAPDGRHQLVLLRRRLPARG